MYDPGPDHPWVVVVGAELPEMERVVMSAVLRVNAVERVVMSAVLRVNAVERVVVSDVAESLDLLCFSNKVDETGIMVAESLDDNVLLGFTVVEADFVTALIPVGVLSAV